MTSVAPGQSVIFALLQWGGADNKALSELFGVALSNLFLVRLILCAAALLAAFIVENSVAFNGYCCMGYLFAAYEFIKLSVEFSNK